jgi:cardiolipin synthase
MNTGTDMNWKREFTETIDQRALKLPPAWMSTGQHLASRSERGHAIYASGKARTMADAVVALLDKAQEKSVVSSFLLADAAIQDAMLRAAARGVRVYVLLASEARLGREQGDGEFDKLVLEQHKAMLAKLGGHVLFRSAPHFHAKVVVIDPDMRPAGILLTANLTTEALERNEELGIALDADEVAELTAYLKWAMWESAEHELLDPKDRFKAAHPLGKVAHPKTASAIVATTARVTSIRDELLRLIDGARSRIIVSSFGWDDEHEVVQRLCARARAGLELIVLARVRPASMPALLALAEAGAAVCAFKWLHAKAIWTDRGEALVMSANLQHDGLDHGFELGVRLSGARAQELGERLSAWRNTAPWELMAHPRLGDLSGTVQLWLGRQLREEEISASMDVELPTVKADSADALEAHRPPLPGNGELPRLAHSLRCTWAVAAPVLAAKAKERWRPIQGDEKPVPYAQPVFQEPSGRIVVAVKSPDELECARAVAAEVGALSIVLAEGVLQ